MRIQPMVIVLFTLILSPLASGQPFGRFERTVEGFPAKVVVDIPRNYTAKRAWGLVVGLHGTGMNGRQLAAATDVRAIHKAGYLTVFPTSHHRAWGTAGSGGGQADKDKAIAYLEVVLQTMLAEYSIHPDKVHLIGYSAGSIISAYGTGLRSEWNEIKIRSISCHSGGLGGRTTARPGRRKEMAVWVLNGALDTPHDRLTRNLHAMFDSAKYDAKFTEVPGVGHIFPLVPWARIIGWWRELDKQAPQLDRSLALLAKADRYLGRKKWRSAWQHYTRAAKELGDKSAQLLRAAERGKQAVEAEAKQRLDEAASYGPAKKLRARRLLQKMARDFKGTPFETAAKGKLADLKAR